MITFLYGLSVHNGTPQVEVHTRGYDNLSKKYSVHISWFSFCFILLETGVVLMFAVMCCRSGSLLASRCYLTHTDEHLFEKILALKSLQKTD